MEEGCLTSTLAKFPNISRAQVRQVILNESPSDHEVTKSLCNLLYNLVKVGSVPVSQTQKEFLDGHAELVLELINKRKSLKWKQAALAANIPLVLNIVASCPTVDGW